MAKKIKLNGSFLEDEDGKDVKCDKIFVTLDEKEAWGVDTEGREVFRLKGISASIVITGGGGDPVGYDKTVEERLEILEAIVTP